MWENIQQISVFNWKQKYHQSNYIYYQKATAKALNMTKF